jgi:Pyruvate/2-oxoacid:ferredoxin oxidoreductase delta subunit
MVPSDRTITSAVGHGKKAARAIDAWLRGSTDTPAPKHPVASFEKLHLPVYSDAERREAPRLAAAERTAGFAEVVAGLTEAQATYEAQRCLSCGNCFECDQCFAGCPEKAIEKLGPGQGYRYRYERCTGCAICSEGCPVHAIEMIPEPAAAG